jgi:predicted amidohydrolase YtcJ
MKTLSRRDFIKLSALTLGGIALAGCRGDQIVRMTATPAPTSGAQPKVVSTTKPSASSPVAAPTFPPGTIADTIFTNGKVIVMDASDTTAQAIAVKDGRILQIGTDDKIRALAGPNTKTVDLRGRVLMPGLIDPHNHLRVMGLQTSFFVPFLPPEVKTLPEMQTKLSQVAAKTPKGQWIVAYYFTVGGVTAIPAKEDLDKAAPDHPVFMMHQAGHYATVNSLGLKLGGITASTASPSGGIIEKDAKGEPTGRLFNHRAMNIVRSKIPPYSPDMVRASIVETAALFATCGVTSFQDNNVYGDEDINAYQDVAKQGMMSIRGSYYHTLEWPADLPPALKLKPFDESNMKFGGYKFLVDGQATTAFCHEPHNGTRWNMSTWEVTSYKQVVRALHDTGMQICVHCGGDAAVDMALDAFEEAMKANPRPDPRHRIEHAVLTTPQATKRMRDLGIIVSTNPIFIRSSGDSYFTLFGEKRTQERTIVTREWLDAGIPVTIGSDAPTTPWYSPQATLAAAVTRLTLTNRVLGANHTMTIKEALRAHTITAAYAAFEEKIKGSLEPGKLADMIVWTQDPYPMTPEQLFNSTVDLTMVGGKIVYQKT